MRIREGSVLWWAATAFGALVWLGLLWLAAALWGR